MNISPVSFGKIVKVNDSKSNAFNIASLANSIYPVKQHECIQKEAQKIFNDITPDGQATVLTTNGSKDVYIVSGKDAEEASKIFGQGGEVSYCSRRVGGKETELGITVKKLGKKADRSMTKFLKKGLESFEIKICNCRDDFHIAKVDKKA